MSEYRNEAHRYFDQMSDDEFYKLLSDAGFEIEEGVGEIVFEENVIFPEDQERINSAVTLYPLGSYHIGEIAMLSGRLYEMGVDVVELLQRESLKREG